MQTFPALTEGVWTDVIIFSIQVSVIHVSGRSRNDIGCKKREFYVQRPVSLFIYFLSVEAGGLFFYDRLFLRLRDQKSDVYHFRRADFFFFFCH